MKKMMTMKRMIPCMGMALCLTLTVTSCQQKKQEQTVAAGQSFIHQLFCFHQG